MVCATNAGIYDKQLQPLGLYVEGGNQLRRLNTRKNAYGNFYLQPNGVFVLSERQAYIVETSDYEAELGLWNGVTRYATQSGPLMIVDGKINPRFDPESANTVVRNCLDAAGIVTLAIARNPISFYDFASFLRDELKCRRLVPRWQHLAHVSDAGSQYGSGVWGHDCSGEGHGGK
jgi:uncharacterized protein YigE (DUF2233 family)